MTAVSVLSGPIDLRGSDKPIARVSTEFFFRGGGPNLRLTAEAGNQDVKTATALFDATVGETIPIKESLTVTTDNIGAYFGKSPPLDVPLTTLALDTINYLFLSVTPASAVAAESGASLSGPTLGVQKIGDSIQLSWPTGFNLESSADLRNSQGWMKWPLSGQIVGQQNAITITPAVGSLFFRLRL